MAFKLVFRVHTACLCMLTEVIGLLVQRHVLSKTVLTPYLNSMWYQVRAIRLFKNKSWG